MPSVKLSSSTVPPSSSVAGRRSSSRPVTGRPYSIEVPRSPADQTAEKGDELPGERLVQSVPCAKRFDLLRGQRPIALARERIAGKDVDQQEQQHERERQRERRLQRPAHQPAAHSVARGPAGWVPVTVHSRRPSQGDSGRMRTLPNRRSTAA